ncbi:MAG TPA: hypothetical protein VKT49_15095 [Bryobacteraceae bacterium]|nr:hypothetical protein [Bryobacteraceae bacterium]
MTVRTLMIATSSLLAGLSIGLTPARAQGPLYDQVQVNIPYVVTLGDTTLQPGQYTIRELQSTDKQRVLLIYSDNGVKHEATVMTIPAYDNRTQDDTKVVLHHYGPDYYFDKVWIAGKNYGYEFPVPQNVKERQREREGPVSVAATYQPAAQPATTAAAAPPAETPTPAPSTPPPANQQEAQNTPPPPPANEQVAQNAPPPAQQNAQGNSEENSANRQAPETNNQPGNEKLPSTSADWMTLLLAGGTLSSIGLALRRKWC